MWRQLYKELDEATLQSLNAPLGIDPDLMDIIAQLGTLIIILTLDLDVVFSSSRWNCPANEGAPMSSLIHPDDWDKLLLTVHKVAKAEGKLRLGVEHRVRDGKDWRWYLTEIEYIHLQGGNYILLTSSDITYRIGIESAMIRAQALMHTVITQSNMILIAVNQKGNVIFVEGRGTHKLGINIPKLVGRSIRALVRLVVGNDSSVLTKLSVALQGQESTWTLSYNDRLYECNASPLAIVNERIGTVIVATDVTDLMRKSEELKQFASIVSHDLHEPLRMIASYLDLLTIRYADSLDERAQGYIRTVVEASIRMDQLLKDLLAYSRLELKQSEVCSLKQCVQDAQTNLLVAIEERHGLVHVHSDKDVQLLANGILITQLFQNLIANGLKFNESPQPTIEVKWVKSGTKVLISIRDNGIGIASAYYKVIFLPYKRLHNPTLYSGTGMGLAFCKKIVEAHQGRIWLESLENGTIFYVELDLAGQQ